MGILNVTPDSFSDGGKYVVLEAALGHAQMMISQGADIIDIGAASSRPGAKLVSADEELARLKPIVPLLIAHFPNAIFSIDTFHAAVAAAMLELGVHIVNDISGGTLDREMLAVVARYKCPYVLMHMQGTPQTMQVTPSYNKVLSEVWEYFRNRIEIAQSMGILDIILDVGFGFGKRPEDNNHLFQSLAEFSFLPYPMLVGISRKSFIKGLLPPEASKEEWQAATAALHLLALQRGARILRVHEVAPAKRVIALYLKGQDGTL
jgi:dihydropteroate synthase